MDLTLLEVSLDGAEITANAPFSGGGSKGSDEADDEPSPSIDTSSDDADEDHSTETSSGPGALVATLLSVGAVVVLAVVLKRVLSSEDEPESV